MASKAQTSKTKDAGQHARHDHNKENIIRINRILGQLEALKRTLEADEESCEERVIRARTIQKGMESLISHMVECYFDNTLREEMQSNPDLVIEDITRLFQLLNR